MKFDLISTVALVGGRPRSGSDEDKIFCWVESSCWSILQTIDGHDIDDIDGKSIEIVLNTSGEDVDVKSF